MAPTAGIDPATQPDMFRECCWLVEKRGCVGETTFHICFLMQSPVHLALGRRLLKHYPKLINDVYLSEEYYGKYETVDFRSNIAITIRYRGEGKVCFLPPLLSDQICKIVRPMFRKKARRRRKIL